MAKKRRTGTQETDGAYFLKMVLYLILGSMWVKITRGTSLQIPIPVGFILGLIFTTHEHFRIDKKVEYAILLVSMFIGFWLPIGIFLYF